MVLSGVGKRKWNNMYLNGSDFTSSFVNQQVFIMFFLISKSLITWPQILRFMRVNSRTYISVLAKMHSSVVFVCVCLCGKWITGLLKKLKLNSQYMLFEVKIQGFLSSYFYFESFSWGDLFKNFFATPETHIILGILHI